MYKTPLPVKYFEPKHLIPSWSSGKKNSNNNNKVSDITPNIFLHYWGIKYTGESMKLLNKKPYM